MKNFFQYTIIHPNKGIVGFAWVAESSFDWSPEDLRLANIHFGRGQEQFSFNPDELWEKGPFCGESEPSIRVRLKTPAWSNAPGLPFERAAILKEDTQGNVWVRFAGGSEDCIHRSTHDIQLHPQYKEQFPELSI